MTLKNEIHSDYVKMLKEVNDLEDQRKHKLINSKFGYKRVYNLTVGEMVVNAMARLLVTDSSNITAASVKYSNNNSIEKFYFTANELFYCRSRKQVGLKVFL